MRRFFAIRQIAVRCAVELDPRHADQHLFEQARSLFGEDLRGAGR